jgi:hypothetical protein
MQFQKIRRMMKSALHCHPERSEGSGALDSEMLRFAQHDSAVPPAASPGCHPERSEGLARWAASCFAECTLSVANVLSMTLLSPIPMPGSICSSAL